MRKRLTRMTLATVLLASAAVAADTDANWPRFRGPNALGVAENSKLPDSWDTKKNVEWKAEIPGRGWSSPIVWGDRVFLTTVVSTGKTEEPRKGLYFGGDRFKASKAVHEWRVLCLDLTTGKVLWNQLVEKAAPGNPIHIKNSYSSETPVTDGQRVYAYFGNVGVFAFILNMERDGKHVTDIASLGTYSAVEPARAACLAVLMFSLAGVPPLAGFFGKFYVFMAAINAGLYYLAVIGVLASVVGAFYYLRIIKMMYFDEADEKLDGRLQMSHRVALAGAAFVMVVGWLPFINGFGLIEASNAAAATLLQ